MNIIPAIDLKDGNCVRLFQGDFSQQTIYNNDPLEVAQDFQNQGAEFLHIVDLDGAKSGAEKHLKIIETIVNKTTLKVQTGGGIRSLEHIKKRLDIGVDKVVLGSIAVLECKKVNAWLEQYPQNITLAFDVEKKAQNFFLKTAGWQKDSDKDLFAMCAQFCNLEHVLCTDIILDGTLKSPNFELYQQLKKQFPDLKIQASGGVSSLDDLHKLKKIGVFGAIVGKALYEKKFTLTQALHVN